MNPVDLPIIQPKAVPPVRKKTVVLTTGRESTIEKLREILQAHGINDSAITNEQLKDLKSIRAVKSIEGGGDYKLDSFDALGEALKESESPAQADNDKVQSAKKGNYHVLSLVENKARIITELRAQLNPQNDLIEGVHYVDETYKKSPDFTGEEGRVHSILTNVIEILDRTFNRRTTLTSWALLAYLKKAGLDIDDFSPIKALVEDPNKAPDFIKKYTNYLKIKSIEPSKALEEFNENEKKIVKLFSRTTDFYNSFSMGFVRIFPIVFSIENIALPIVNRISSWIAGEDNFISKTIEKLMVINPWLNEFAESLGNYFEETKKLQGTLRMTPEEVRVEESKSKTLEEIELSGFENTHEYNLNKIVSKVDDAAARLLGKGNTVSSMVLGQVLRSFADEGKGSYKNFIKDYRDNPVFVKKFHSYLNNGSTDKDGKEVLDKWWDKSVAKIVKGVVGIVSSFSNETLNKITNNFGIANAIINPVVPFLSLFIRKGPIAWMLHAVRDILPIFSDLFVDHIANFRKEVVDIKKVTEDEDVRKLFPDLEQGVKPFVDNMTGVWTTVTGFASKFKAAGRSEAASTGTT
jgi:hypothetical protein